MMAVTETATVAGSRSFVEFLPIFPSTTAFQDRSEPNR